MNAKELVPLFIPPLATMLAEAERVKGKPLTEAEAVRVRDGATCIMLQPSDAEKMIETRGFRDVNPESCWADWHRLRTQMTGDGFLPKIVLCLLGGVGFAESTQTLLNDSGATFEVAPRDERMANAFEASAFRPQPTLNKAELRAISQHQSVLYVLSDNFPASEGPARCSTFLQLGRRLLEAGAIAMKCESSGIAHSRQRWIELSESVQRPDDSHWSALFNAFVQFPIQSKSDLHTCGMHLLGKPDLIVSRAMLPVGDVLELFHIFALYLLAECLDGSFASGHTFSVSSASPRFRVIWEPCDGYEEDDFFFNPFGRWRFTEGTSRS